MLAPQYQTGLGAARTRYLPPYPRSIELGLGDGFLGAATTAPTFKFVGDRLLPGKGLRPGEGIKSPNGRVQVILQLDGNLVLYGDNRPLWWTGVRPGVNYAVMQSTDGNFVLYINGGRPDAKYVWASDTFGHKGAYLVAQNDGNLVIYWGVGGSDLWSSETAGFRYYGGPSEPIGTQILSAAGTLLAVAQIAISFVPGIGAGVNAAIAAGTALARGESITDAMVSAAKNALPGGPLAAQAFDVAVSVGKSIANGDSIGEAAVAAARAALPSDEAKKAFDVGLALVQGQNLQQAVIAATAALAPEAARVANTIFRMPQMTNLPIAEIAKALNASTASVTQAIAALKNAEKTPMPMIFETPPVSRTMTANDAAVAMFAALMMWGKDPGNVAAQQQLAGISWKWGEAMKGQMRAEDTALANAIGAWSKAPNDKALRERLISVGQDWGVKRGLIPRKNLVVLKPPPVKKMPVVLPPPRAPLPPNVVVSTATPSVPPGIMYGRYAPYPPM